MGVNGLVPFLSKKCPEVIKELQGGLKALTGKTVVIDGTLVTQRFHFSQSPLKRRSIIGWYRLINDMTFHGVTPICIFDGKERNAAKRREVLRRRAGRVLAAMRGDLEDQRLERLSKMHGTIRALKGLSDEQKKCATRKLKSLMEPAPSMITQDSAEPQIEVEVRADPADIIGLLLSSQEIKKLGLSVPVPCTVPPTSSPLSPPFEGTDTTANIATSQVEPQALPPASDDSDRPPVSSFVPPDQAETTLPPSGNVQETPTTYLTDSAPEKEGESLEAIADTLALLYKEYQDSVVTFNSAVTPAEYPSAAVPIFRSGPDMPNETGLTDRSCEPISEASSEEPSIILRASKHQVELVDLESEAWSLLSAADGETTAGTTSHGIISDKDDQVISQPPETEAPSTPAQFVEQAEEAFHNVGQRSEAIAASYKRRIDAPTEQTYQEVRSLLQAMGVPVVITEGGEEAEAVASALVLEGSGNYVATEDTDVLIHGATMLRNITSHRMKDTSLVTISGLEVRRALEIPTQRAYIDFALLLGTDFTERIKNLGPINAHKLIKEYGSIENVIKLIQDQVVQPTTSKKAPIIAAGEQETTGVVKKPRKSKRVVVREGRSSRYTIQYPLSEYLAHVHMGREVYSMHPPTPAKELLKQKPRDDAALSALLHEWKMDREQLDGPDELLNGREWRLGEGYAWKSGEDCDIFGRFGGSLDWEEPWEGDPPSDSTVDRSVLLKTRVAKRGRRRKVSN